jgi:hypothetical protein
VELTIDKNVPMPRCQRNRRLSAQLALALESMSVGDSVLVPVADTASLSAYCHVIGKKLGRQFVRRGQRIWRVGQRPVPGNPNRVPDAELCDAIRGLVRRHPDWNLWHLGMVMSAKYGVTHQYVRRFYKVFADTKLAARRKRGAQRQVCGRHRTPHVSEDRLHVGTRIVGSLAGLGKSVVVRKKCVLPESAST